MSESTQYRATGLQETMKMQGRKARWLAAKVGVHESLLSHAMSQKKTLSAPVANQISELLGVPFFALFELADACESTAVAVGSENAA